MPNAPTEVNKELKRMRYDLKHGTKRKSGPFTEDELNAKRARVLVLEKVERSRGSVVAPIEPRGEGAQGSVVAAYIGWGRERGR